jgi:hypothetical protein
MQKISADLGIPFFSYDTDVPEQEKKADEFAREFGDWSEDYMIPQVFVELSDGEMRHVLTGRSEGVDQTRRAVNDLQNGPLFAKAGRHVKR